MGDFKSSKFNKKRANIQDNYISLVLVGVISAAIVLCSLLFDVSYKFLKKNVSQYSAKELESAISWDNIHYQFRKGIVINDLTLYKAYDETYYKELPLELQQNVDDVIASHTDIHTNKRVVLYAKQIAVSLDLRKGLRYLLKRYDTLSAYDQDRILKVFGKPRIPLAYIFTKSLAFVKVEGLEGDIVSRQDTALFNFINKKLLTNKILPEDANVNFIDINLKVLLPQVTPIEISTEDFNLDIYLNEEEGIQFAYLGNIGVENIKQQLQILGIKGRISTRDFMENVQMRTDINAVGVNNLFVSPSVIDFHKSQDNFAFNFAFKNSDINLAGSYIDSVLDIDFQSRDARISDILAESYQSFEVIYEDTLNGRGKFVKDLKSRASEYFLNLSTNAVSENQIHIDIYGDENVINISKLIINLENQYIIANGDLSLLTYGANGNLKFSLGEPLIHNSVLGSFVFRNTPFSSIGVGRNLEVNGVRQRDLVIEYSTIDQYLNINLENTNKNILQFRKIGDDVLKLNFNSFPFSMISPFFDFEKVPYFYDAVIDSNFEMRYDGNILSNVLYKLRISYNEKINDYITINGLMLGKKIYIDSSTFNVEKLGIQGRANGYLFTTFYDEEIPISISLDINKEDVHNSLELKMEQDRNKNYNISLAKNFVINLLFEDSLKKNVSTVSEITLNIEKFQIPLSKYTIDSKSSINFESSRIDSFDANIFVKDTDDSSNIFVFQSQFANNEGSIKELAFKNQDYEISTFGDLLFDESRSLVNINLVEVPQKDLVLSELFDTITTQSFSLSYGLNNRNLDITANNLKLGVYSKKLDGLLNFQLLVDLRNKTYLGSLYDSFIVTKKNKFNIAGDFYLSRHNDVFNMEVNNFTLVSNTSKFELNSLKFQDSTFLEGEFNYSTIRENDFQNMYRGNVTLNTEYFKAPIYNKDELLLDTVLKTVGEVDGQLELEPQFSDNVGVYNRYFYNFRIKHLNGVISIFDPNNDVSIQINNNDKTILAFMGNKNSILYSEMRGSYKSDKLNVEVNLNRFNYALFNQEYLRKYNSLEYESLEVTGSLIVRGMIEDPRIYGYLKLGRFNAYMPFFDKDLDFHEVNILLSDNEMSLVNSYVMLDNKKIFFNAQGTINGLLPEEIFIEFFTPKNSPVQVKKLRVGSLEVVGKFAGKVSINIIDNAIDIGGALQFENALISNERLTDRQQWAKTQRVSVEKNQKILSVSIVVSTLNGVVFAWPSNTFPVLRAGFAEGQEIDVAFDSDTRELSILSNLDFNSGVIYYFDRSFNIEQLQLTIDEYNKINNPFIVNLQAKNQFRYNNENYELILSAESTSLTDMQVDIQSQPFLSVSELTSIFGQGIVPESQETLVGAIQQQRDGANTVSNLGLVSSIIKISDPITNIGIFSRLEVSLQRSLKLDFISFKTKVFENLLSYSLENNTDLYNDSVSSISRINRLSLLPYLFSNTSLELGKYINIVYLNLSLELNTDNIISGGMLNYSNPSNSNLAIPIRTSLNVEIPTPLFDLTWTGALQPYYYNKMTYIPINLLTISWKKSY